MEIVFLYEVEDSYANGGDTFLSQMRDNINKGLHNLEKWKKKHLEIKLLA